MSDTFHIKSINELLPNEPGIDERIITYSHYLAGFLEQEHERNNQLEKRIEELEDRFRRHQHSTIVGRTWDKKDVIHFSSTPAGVE